MEPSTMVVLGLVILVGSPVGSIIAFNKVIRSIKTRPAESSDPATDFSGRYQDETGATLLFAMLSTVGILVGGILVLYGLAQLIG